MAQQDRVEDAVLTLDALVHLQPAQAHSVELGVERATAEELQDRRVETPQRNDEPDGCCMRHAEALRDVGGEIAHWALCISLISVMRISGARSSV